VAAQIEPGERHAQEQVNAIAKQPDKGFAGRVDEAVVRVGFRLFYDNRAAANRSRSLNELSHGYGS
jgi:hypothetical protein